MRPVPKLGSAPRYQIETKGLSKWPQGALVSLNNGMKGTIHHCFVAAGSVWYVVIYHSTGIPAVYKEEKIECQISNDTTE